MMRILLIGATGFIGQHTLRKLVGKNYNVLCTKRSVSNLDKLGDITKKCSFIDIESEKWVDVVECFAPQVIINLGWSGVGASNRENWAKQIENLVFQQQLLDLAVRVGVRKFIGMGSQAEYGTVEGCINEEYPTNPNTAYGAVKVASMVILKSFCEENNLQWYWLRLFSCFGEGESDNWLIPAAIKNMLKGGSMDFTSGEQRYAYLYVGEVAQAIAETVSTKAQSGVYNISSQRTISIRDLLIKIRQRVNPEFKLNFGSIPYRLGQSMWMQGDVTKLSSDIYVINETDWNERFNDTINWCTKQYNKL